MQIVRVTVFVAGSLIVSLPIPAAGQCPRVEVVEVLAKASKDTRPVTYQNRTIHVSRTPISTFADIVTVSFDPETPWAIGFRFKPDIEDRMERITGSRPAFPMAVVIDNDVLLSVVLEGGFGIGRGGLQVSIDRNEGRIRKLYDTLNGCLATRVQPNPAAK